MMVGVGSLAALDVLASAAAVIAEGEVMQLSAAKNLDTDERAYLAVIRAKTAALFSAASEVGPIIAGVDSGARAALADYGMNLGLAFQLVDDALDYGGSSAKLGKRVGDDFREGKVTLPVVLANRRGNAEERAFWGRTVEKGEIADGDLDRAIEFVRRHGAIDETFARARAYGDAAVASLDGIPASPWRAALVEVVDFSVARAY
jgi:octaprenyl-diphosphate synthase